MLAVERQKIILHILHRDGIVKINELSAKFNVSEETIRRDLNKLEKNGGFLRTYGGAYITKNVNPDIDISIRESFYLEGKDEIGMLAADLIEDGDTVILDSSTTALHVAEKIRSRENTTVVTNAVKVVTTLSEVTGIKIVSTGGTVRPRSLSFIGPEAESTLSRYFADKAFVSCTGAEMERGITDTNEQDASMRRLMLMQAAKRILIADTTKFGKTAFSFISSFMSLTRLLRTRSLRRSGGIISVS
jgi:DeoR/GlpR family transcriptional regulator of sugar metabolism